MNVSPSCLVSSIFFLEWPSRQARESKDTRHRLRRVCFLIGPPLPLLDAEHPLSGAVMVAVVNMRVKLGDLLVHVLYLRRTDR